MSVGNRIYTEFSRPPKALIASFRDVPVANIDDSMGRLYAVDARIRPLNNMRLHGTAFTVKAPSGDNLMFHKALDMAQEGDVIVVSGIGGGERSFSGEGMIRYALFRKLGGFVVDGFIRDKEGSAELPFPVYARGTQPNGPLKYGPGEINVPVAIGGQVVFPGDILVGDEDGIVVICPADAEEVAAAAKKLAEAEKVKFSGLSQGINTFNRQWIADHLAANRCEVIHGACVEGKEA